MKEDAATVHLPRADRHHRGHVARRISGGNCMTLQGNESKKAKWPSATQPATPANTIWFQISAKNILKKIFKKGAGKEANKQPKLMAFINCQSLNTLSCSKYEKD